MSALPIPARARRARLCLAALAALTLSACALQKPANVSNEARLTPATPSTVDLMRLPPPQRKIVAAVYGFRDETGQYKPSPDSSFSTAVTQGAASMLMKALKDSGWYVPVERAGLQSLLTERRVLRAVGEHPQGGGQQGGGQQGQVPNLLPATIILEGGVIAYDSNTRTGGLGAQFLGIGLSTQYSVDQVTVNLRAVDVLSGAILNSVSTTKTIYSYEIHPSYFRFVNYYDLLEVEGGYTHNEPAQLAVKEAIDAAVMHLTVQGIKDNQWRLKNPGDWNDPLIQRYLDAEKDYTLTVTPRQAAGPAGAAPAQGDGHAATL
ncbi:Curli production assembly/transport component CsgG [Castellaniella defragrans 65Phen]|uniref:Curli production assembly/transport component CsgG n=1 Tax=Castellaniella defragrans (strain DSM 12143 / CCUG 39792 / 65Phen) TaxID=1437824 RepID=W8X5T7_CASD6|nr:CsgG/HfaB family protein [Castellaniella defragrans]CDM25912.1 Curli production assembly/transport component CsgG [Castellaniella defragrans 65Phen]